MRHSSKGDYPHPKKTSTVQSVVRMTDGVCVDDGLSIYKQASDRFFAEHRQEISVLLRKMALLQAVADTGRVSGLRDTASKEGEFFGIKDFGRGVGFGRGEGLGGGSVGDPWLFIL